MMDFLYHELAIKKDGPKPIEFTGRLYVFTDADRSLKTVTVAEATLDIP